MRIRYIIPTTIVILGRNMSRDQAFTKPSIESCHVTCLM